MRRADLVTADPPGSGLDASYGDAVCRDVIREQQEKVRAEWREEGADPIFPPKPRSVDEFLGEHDDPNISSADMIAEIRGRGPPDGYELVRVENGAGQ